MTYPVEDGLGDSGALCGVVQVGDRSIRFALDDPEDEIQRYLLDGVFYEAEQLDFHRSLIPRNGRVFDLGANIGNHSVYYASVCAAESVIAVEPNFRAARLFTRTLEMNALDNIELLGGLAIGAGSGWAVLDQTEAAHHNLGGTSVNVVPNECDGSLPVRTGDSVMNGRDVDFIKIDVEGSELQVLTGLQGTIYKQSPVIAVEVMPLNRQAFFNWCQAHTYRIERTFQMYRGIMNYVCLPSF